MPANLPAEAKAKWLKVMEAKTPEEKIRALQEFLSAVPKHKGTEKLIMHARRQMAILRRKLEIEQKKRRGKRAGFFIEKEGAAQAVMLGFPNSGKSALLSCLTGTSVDVSPSPYTTKKPTPAMLIWEGVYFQLIDTPSLVYGDRSSSTIAEVMALARNADFLILVIDLTYDPLSQLSELLRILEEYQISLVKPRGVVKISKRRLGGITVVGTPVDGTATDVEKLLKSYGIQHALVEISGHVTLDDIEEKLYSDKIYKPAAIILTKTDITTYNVKNISTEISLKLPSVKVFCTSTVGNLDTLRAELGKYMFETLDLVRVYTRNPKTGEVASRPLVVKRGTKVIDVARMIHSRLYKNFRYARVWSRNFKFNPQRVGRDYEVADGDIVEIHA